MLLAMLRADLRQVPSLVAAGWGQVLGSDKEEADADAAERVAKLQQIFQELRRCGIDPKPPRHGDRAAW